jgi:hypothetical protein
MIDPDDSDDLLTPAGRRLSRTVFPRHARPMLPATGCWPPLKVPMMAPLAVRMSAM